MSPKIPPPDPTLRRHDLLADPLFTIHRSGEKTTASLPRILAHLGAGEEIEPAALRAHQQHAWHAFLVQLAALVANRRGADHLTLSPEEWCATLLELATEAGGSSEAAGAAWHLVVGDSSLPGFFQTPVPEGNLNKYKKEIHSPDELDVVVTTRNHDVKQERMTEPRPEHWVYALVTLQTMEGYMGRGNYGIARMNGGLSNRPCLAAAPDLGWAARFQRDTAVWLDRRTSLRKTDSFPDTGGRALLWIWPWDGEKSSKLPLRECDPFFIEVCRRIRVTPNSSPHGGEQWLARMAATKDYRVNSDPVQGATGDVWTPTRSKDGAALTVSGRGFHYTLLSQILFGGDYRTNPALQVRHEDGQEPVLVAQTLARGQGVTEGYHQRVLRLTAQARSRMEADPEVLGRRAEAQIELAYIARRKVLHPALCSLLQKGASQLNFQNPYTAPYLDAFDREVDDRFFDHLWATAGLDDEDDTEHQASWQRLLRGLAHRHFNDARDSLPLAAAHRARARARSELFLRRLMRQHFTLAFPAASDPNQQETVTNAA